MVILIFLLLLRGVFGDRNMKEYDDMIGTCLDGINRVSNHHAVNLGTNSITLQWTVPVDDNNGRSFHIEYKQAYEKAWTEGRDGIEDLGHGGTMTVTVSDLSPSTRYVFRVYVQCLQGRSPYSSVADATTMDSKVFEPQIYRTGLIIGGVLSVMAMLTLIVSLVYVVTFRNEKSHVQTMVNDRDIRVQTVAQCMKNQAPQSQVSSSYSSRSSLSNGGYENLRIG